MSTIPGTYVELVETGVSRLDTLINDFVFPTVAEYEQIVVNYEGGTPCGPREVRFTYQNWNRAYPVELHLNGGAIPLDGSLFEPDYEMGRIKLGFDLAPGDSVMATYCFNYFPRRVLEGFANRAVVVCNTGGDSAPTSYTIRDIPEGWLGILSDLVISMCMEKLILEYDLWKGRLIFAISNNQIYDGGDNIVSQLETVKKNAEERAYMSIRDNKRLRCAPHLARPTAHYFEALLVGSAARYKNGTVSYGPLRGAKFNRMVGILPRA